MESIVSFPSSVLGRVTGYCNVTADATAFSRDARVFSRANKYAAVFRATQRHSDLKSNQNEW